MCCRVAIGFEQVVCISLCFLKGIRNRKMVVLNPAKCLTEDLFDLVWRNDQTVFSVGTVSTYGMCETFFCT